MIPRENRIEMGEWRASTLEIVSQKRQSVGVNVDRLRKFGFAQSKRAGVTRGMVILRRQLDRRTD